MWSGQRVSLPENRQKVFFKNGTATVNIWQEPSYRLAKGIAGSAFDTFLEFVMPRENERGVFLDWLAWCLQNEGRKPGWAVMLFSEKQGTGKSTLANVMKALFGEENAGRVNGIGKLVGRFNKEILEKKLVIVEEVEVRKGSPQANSLKSLITEESTMVEAKGMPAFLLDIYCAFIMTSNHLPLWLEESDRRFFILNFDHQGYTNGGAQHKEFKRICDAARDQASTPEGLRGIYDNLMQRVVPLDFGHALDLASATTEIMEDLQELSPDIVKQVLGEFLHNKNILFVPTNLAIKLINKIAPREANAQTHLMTELGYKKKKFMWSGGVQRRAWYKIVDPKFPIKPGKIWSGHNYDDMSLHEEKLAKWLDEKVGDEEMSASEKAKIRESDGLSTIQAMRLDNEKEAAKRTSKSPEASNDDLMF